MSTVLNRTQTIRERLLAAGALLCGGSMAFVLAPAIPAASQELGPLRGDVTEEAVAADGTDVPVVTSLRAPEPADLPERAGPVMPIGPLQGSGAAPEDDPFAAGGLRFGSFILRPSAEVGLTGSREVNGSASAVNRLLSDTSLRVELASDWDRHALNVTAAGDLQQPLSGGGDLEPTLSIDASGTR